MTNVPPVEWTPQGFVVPATSVVLSAVMEDINAAFGGNLNMQLDTPQGQLATSWTAVIDEVNSTFLMFSQQVDPAFNTGKWQDAIARIYFLQRNPSLPTVVQALCTGLPGVVIPVNAVAVAADGSQYYSEEEAVIGTDGTVTTPFAALIPGPTPCPAGTLTQIFQAIPGWDSITNPEDGVLGQDTETRAAFEARRVASVAANSVGSLPSVLGAVLHVAGVLDAYVTENDSSSPTTIGGYSLNPNSLYVAVVGGTDADVAQAIWSKKAPGCAYNGNTTVVVQDTSQGYVPPYPSYNVSFERPASLPIVFAVEVVNSPSVPSDATALIQAAVISAFAGEDGGTRATIGAPVYALRYASAISALGSWAQLLSLQVGSPNTPSAVFTAAITDTEMTVSAVASGTLAIGQTLFGETTPLSDSTTIVSQDSGPPGGTGTYTVSISQTQASQTVQGVVADLDSVTVNIDQAPTVTAADIQVTLS